MTLYGRHSLIRTHIQPDWLLVYRIEDDVLITEDGSEVLSKDIIKEIDDIERILISK